MVVIVLVAILSAAILPEMRGTFAGATLRAAGRDLANLCALAASRSVSFNQIHRVRIDPATGRFGLEHQPRAARRETAFVPVRDVPHVRGQLDARLTARLAVPPDSGATRDATRPPAPLDRSAKEDAPADALVFYPDGTADPGAILLRHQDGSGLLLRVNPATARVRISDWSPP
jgi:type II secretory pathway pseudopilin PulG